MQGGVDPEEMGAHLTSEMSEFRMKSAQCLRARAGGKGRGC